MGGYKIIDFKDIDITVGGEAVKIEGVYEALESNYRKPTVLANLTVNGVERTDRYAVFGVKEGNYESIIAISGDVGLLTCTITPEDMVTLVEQ